DTRSKASSTAAAKSPSSSPPPERGPSPSTCLPSASFRGHPGSLIAGMEDVPGKCVARKSPLLQLRIGQLAQGVVESCSCPIVSAAFHPGHEEFSEGLDGRGKRRCCVRYDGFANECLLMECHNESLLALSSE